MPPGPAARNRSVVNPAPEIALMSNAPRCSMSPDFRGGHADVVAIDAVRAWLAGRNSMDMHEAGV